MPLLSSVRVPKAMCGSPSSACQIYIDSPYSLDQPFGIPSALAIRIQRRREALLYDVRVVDTAAYLLPAEHTI